MISQDQKTAAVRVAMTERNLLAQSAAVELVRNAQSGSLA
jgi:hypothetical protein